MPQPEGNSRAAVRVAARMTAAAQRRARDRPGVLTASLIFCMYCQICRNRPFKARDEPVAGTVPGKGLGARLTVLILDELLID